MNIRNLVSVVIPAYNVGPHIVEAIDSVLQQNYPHIELIVVDDGSQDDTADVVAKRYPQAILIRKANGGAATARNAGIRAARGEFIAFLDADDIWLPGKLRAQVEYLGARVDVSMICTGFSHWTSDRNGVFPDLLTMIPDQSDVAPGAIDSELSGWIYHKLLLHNFVWTTTVMMRRSLIDRIGFYDEKFRLGQDYEYFLRASRETEVHRLSRIYALYRHHPGSATARGNDYNYGASIMLRARDTWGLASPNGESISEREFRERVHKIHFMSGYRLYQRGNLATAFDEFKLAVKERPLHLKSWAYAALAATRAILQ
ncbi:glycosyltransferase family 2 protein [Aromatoleum aromaticum]|uniref:Glycosyl transferase, family 2 n=1 Tax=Aromatoleum aromaticum (strain DSM 19018 / LMG 30748 / EbN1) TaxID=76114 RepID=Q5P2A3_AROAE|nr:glycosyltransferase [Aromatoleum aromaticum]NMG56094.1 glycosyltransferase [Aromatoleum aromaticum]CAI08561.1 Glycosyl transferase, family 2 [Aromatoleum aromaticum EbN1]